MNEKTTKPPIADNLFLDDAFTSEKKIGQTIYIATTRFNGDKRRDMASALMRLIERDSSIIAG